MVPGLSKMVSRYCRTGAKSAIACRWRSFSAARACRCSSASASPQGGGIVLGEGIPAGSADAGQHLARHPAAELPCSRQFAGEGQGVQAGFILMMVIS